MNRILVTFLIITGVYAFSIPSSIAGTDEYLGDASIYAGVPSNVTRPNVLIIIDNSQSTLQTAAGRKYDPTHTYTDGPFDPWTVYHGDQQGQIEVKWDVMANSDNELLNISCRDNSDVVRKTLKLRGTYTGAGDSFYPNIEKQSPYGCDTSASNGEVYALGNYMNYLNSGYVPPEAVDETLPEECQAPLPIVSVDQSVTILVCTNTNPQGKCTKEEEQTKQITNYYRLLSKTDSSHTSSDSNKPGSLGGDNYWGLLSPGDDYDSTVWSAAGQWYQNPLDLPECQPEEPVTPPDPTTLRTQREIMFSALETAVGAALGKVNFGAMIYSQEGQKGGQLIFPMTDLSRNEPTETDPDGNIRVVAPICQNEGGTLINSAKPFCQFLIELPGPDRDGDGNMDGWAPLTSETARPQAETLFDAGVYFGAIPLDNAIKNDQVISEDDKNECNLNHIILLTNGFSNKDSDTAIQGLIGDEDLDHYPDENQYGLGSHWLDDVARYLKSSDMNITTHTVLAFQGEDALVKNAAEDGGGDFFNVWNEEQLAAALLDLLANIINDSSTSFVAPVVPASTTNRTISSNKVYLGLFRPQEKEPWRGNIKKYGLNSATFELTGYDGIGATYANGEFKPNSISYWSLKDDDTIPTGALKDADYIEITATKGPTGDGAQVDTGGAGGVLTEKVRALAAAIRNEDTWEPLGANWRNIYTYTGSVNALNDASNAFLPDKSLMSTGNDNIDATTLGVDNEDQKNALIRYIHGLNYDDLHVISQTSARKWALGDILHSRPLVFNYSRYPESAENRCEDSPDENGYYNSSIIYAGANDGMLHAFRDCDGQEIWAFVPPNVLPYLKYIKNPQAGHPTFVDSAPSLLVYDEHEDGIISGQDKVILVFGQRRGGGTNFLDEDSSRGAYYALDVTDPDAPVFLWELDNDETRGGLSELGETWSQPRLAKVRVTKDDGQTDPDAFKLVAFIGTGYDNNEDLRFGNTQSFNNSAGLDINKASAGGSVDGLDGNGNILVQSSSGTETATSRYAPRGRGLAAINVATYTRGVSGNFEPTLSSGAFYWTYPADSNSGDDPLYSFASDLTVLDMDGDSFADTIYTGDTGGNLWRFKVSDPTPSNWTGTILFKSNEGADDNSVGRKIFYRPAVAYIGAPHIYFGTGDREHPLNIATEDRMYCVIDWGNNGSYPINESDLKDVTLNDLQDDLTMTSDEAQVVLDELYSTPASNPDGFTYGWFVKLDGTDRDPTNGDPGEKMLAPPTVFNSEVYFSTYQLIIGTQSGCDGGNLGISRLYHMDYKTGEAVMNYDTDNDSEDGSTPVNERAIGGEAGELLQRSDRVRELGQGIPSGIVTIIDASGRVTQLISSSDKVEATGTADIKLISPVYWMQW